MWSRHGCGFGDWPGLPPPQTTAHALGLIDTSLATHPMLRLDPEFMVSVIAVYASIGDPRAAILAEQMLEADMNDGQRRLLIMTQVKIKLNAGDLPGAGEVYRKLKALAPQSEETIAARELIKAAVIKGEGESLRAQRAHGILAQGNALGPDSGNAIAGQRSAS